MPLAFPKKINSSNSYYLLNYFLLQSVLIHLSYYSSIEFLHIYSPPPFDLYDYIDIIDYVFGLSDSALFISSYFSSLSD